ncbi:MAG TPA: hypothetical protein VFS20_28640 [Longimicrobium sp.]|nr:hypothetical protein [Longimicrobium sp.]
MAPDELTALGLELRAQAVGWLEELLDGCTLPGAEAAAEPLWELGLLETAVVRLADEIAELTRVEATLTSGFPGSPAPALPVDDTASEAADTQAPPRRGPAGQATARASTAVPAGAGEDRTWDAVPASASRSVAWPTSTGEARRRLELPASPAPESPEASAGGVPAEPDLPRRARSLDTAPPSSVGIRGLGDLAMLAGSSGLDLPPDAEPAAAETRADSGPAAGPRQWDGASPAVSARSGEASWPSPAPTRDEARSPTSGSPPIRRRAWDLSPMAGGHADASGAEWDGSAAQEDAPLPGFTLESNEAPSATPAAAPIRRRAWDHLPAGDPAEASGAAWEGGLTREDRGTRGGIVLPESAATAAREGSLALGAVTSGPIALPFLRMPGETADEGSPDGGDAAPFFPAPAAPTRPVVPPAVRGGGRTSGPAASDFAGGDADEPVALPRSSRRRPAAEILAGLQMTPPIAGAVQRQEASPHAPVLPVPPTARLAPEAGAAPDPTPRAIAGEVPVAVVRAAEHAPPAELPEPLSWPDLDVAELMDALTREIMHEYRRHYGV